MGGRALPRAGALALALLAGVAPQVQAVAAAAATARPSVEPLQVHVGKNKAFSRVEFQWAGAVGYTTQRDGDTLTVRFSRDADPDLSLLNVDPPPYVKAAILRRKGRMLDVVMTLSPNVDVRSGQADGAVWLNLAPRKPDDPAKEAAVPAAPTRPDPRPASGVVKMQVEAAPGRVLLHFPWRAPLGAAVFRRGEAVWVVFDTPAKLDVAAAPPRGAAFKGVQVVAGADYSAVRIASPSTADVKAWADGGTWTVSLGQGGAQAFPAAIQTRRDPQAIKPALQADVAGATRAVWVSDPVVGDRLGAVTALAPSKGVLAKRAFVDLSLLPSAQGLGVETSASDLTLAIDGEWVRITRPRGLALSASVGSGQAKAATLVGLPQAASMPGLIDHPAWSRLGQGGFMTRYSDLQKAAADEMNREAAGDKQAGIYARMGMARFLVGSELSYEAIGVLNLLARKHPELMGDPEFRGMRGAARAMSGRFKEADNDFSVPFLQDDPASALWRGYSAAMQNDWPTAQAAFVKGAWALNQFTPAWQSRFARAYAETALEQGQLNVASTEVALSIAQTQDPLEQLAARLIQARLIEVQGGGKRALPLYDAVARTPLDRISTPALMHAAQIRLTLGQINPNQAAGLFASLRYRWRGDRVEVGLIRSLGQVYLAQGRYRDAMDTFKSVASQHIAAPEMQDVQTDLAKTFRVLFMDGLADGLQPIQALGLFYDFKDLTPLGADGDLMVRKLARRLVDVDLLDQASELLKYQADNRLNGVAKAQVATDLATLYLMDRKPEKAIEAINDSRTTILPTPLQQQRRLIEARAWLALNNPDHATELLGKDASADADAIRADVAWRGHLWSQAGGLLERTLGERWKAAGPLAPDEEAMLMRAGIAFSLADDDAALNRLRAHYGAMVDQARAPEALRVALAGTEGVQVSTRDFSKVAADADIFSGWVIRMKQRFKDAPAPTSKVASAGTTAAKG